MEEQQSAVREVLLEDGLVRFYEARDREAVRRICCETGILGQPIDAVFEDRELFADYLTSYYTDVEPESALVIERGGEVKGYLLGSKRPWRQKLYEVTLLPSLAVRGLLRYRNYRAETREYIAWILKSSRNEVPPLPKGMAHFHFNILPEAQSYRGTMAITQMFYEYLRRAGVKAVGGQLVTIGTRRLRMLERMGFKVLGRSEITKWRGKCPEPVFLTSVVKEL